MEFEVIEQTYPEDFRFSTTRELGEQLNKRQSVVFIGMRRVGISNFLRFFLYHKKNRHNFAHKVKQLFIAVDLNDLTERSTSAFWVLTLKRILDATEISDFNPKTRKYIETLFLDGIQSKDLFILIENIKKALNRIIAEGSFPTIFFIRFDRISEAASAEFFANLEGIKDSTHNKLSFVFTTSRGLNSISPKVFSHTSLSLAQSEIYLKPAEEKDLRTISSAYIKRFGLRISEELEDELIRLVGGYVQYLQLALIVLNDPENSINKPRELFDFLNEDERILLQSEELWDGLNEEEKDIMVRVFKGEALSGKDLKNGKYLVESGFLIKEKADFKVFSPLFENFLKNKISSSPVKEKEGIPNKLELSKKEHLLFSYLKDNLDTICEREAIIEAVWPEEEALGVSDWAIDRLVARLRKKIKLEGEFEIVTVKTRGFKLVKN